MPGPILVVDDDPSMCEMIESYLRLRGLETKWYTKAEEAFEVLDEGNFDVILTDLHMPGMDGIDLCTRVVANRPDIPVIVITAFGSLETAIGALRAGAFDFVTKPINLEVLALTIERARRHCELTEKVKVLSETVARSRSCGQLIGESAPMRKLYERMERIAPSDASVLIVGESGTGKELVARALHEKSQRHGGPFVPVNCAALPDALLESELFGHAKGAFTDARKARRGLFLEADHGSLFLDEIGDFPLPLQPKLLRVLEERTIRAVGSDKETSVDVRVIAATHHDLEAAVEKGRFREDLFFRINVLLLEVPPLRARGTDILLLAQHFTEEFASRYKKEVTGLSKAVADMLLRYSWRGNVRELRNAMERAVALTSYDAIAVEDLPKRIRAYESAHVVIDGSDPADLLPLEEIERQYVLHALKSVGGNRTSAARTLGIDRKTLYRKLRSYGVGEDD